MEEKLNNINKNYSDKIAFAKSLEDLDEIFLALFGKKGEITLFPKNFSALSKAELKIISPLFNKAKLDLEKAIEEKREEVREEKYRSLKNDKIEIGKEIKVGLGKGHLHPSTIFIKEIEEAFNKIGFQRFEAPYIDSEYYNFEVLNIPKNHPARDLWDTLYLDQMDSEHNNFLLRTHTSNSQVRIMEKYKPPFRMINIGTCFRYENIDARHEHTFDQFEIVMVEKGLNMANLQYLSEYFFKAVFGKDIKAKLRPKYYPFVEPGAGVDGQCIFCLGKACLPDGQGCKTCGSTGWLELAGAGMIHPQVLKNGGIDPEIYSGIAWGIGIGRVLMLKYNINDVRLLNSGDLKFLRSFK